MRPGGLYHPYSRAYYVNDGHGRVEVTTVDGRHGLFTGDGRWLEGELRDADPQLCGWIGGIRIENQRLRKGAHEV